MRNDLTIFLASPGDLSAEREATRRAVDKVNGTIGANVGRRFHLTMSDHVQPDFGRPQSLINPLVDACDIFLGLVHRRWGTETGLQSSGFFEEFERALDRRRHSDLPRIGIYFRAVDPTQIADAGPQLAQVLQFRSRLEHEHLVYFREFLDERDFETQISLYLATLLTSDLPLNQIGPDSPTNSGGIVRVSASDIGDQAQVEIAELFRNFATVVSGESVDAVLDYDRLLLLASAVTNDAELPPTHIVNRLYLRNQPISLARSEYAAWLRAFLAGMGRANGRGDISVVAGWKVLCPPDAREPFWEMVGENLLYDHAEVYRGALNLLVESGSRPVYLWPRGEQEPGTSRSTYIDRWSKLLADHDSDMSLLHYIWKTATEIDYPILRAVAELLAGKRPSDEVRSLVAAKEGALGSLTILLPTRRWEKPTAWVVAAIVAQLGSISADDIRSILYRDIVVPELLAPVVSELVSRRLVERDDFAAVLRSGLADSIRDMLDGIGAEHPIAVRSALADAVGLVGKESLPYGIFPHVLASIFPSRELLEMSKMPIEGVDAWVAFSLRPSGEVSSFAQEVYDSDGAALEGAIPEIADAKYAELLRTWRTKVRFAAIRVMASGEYDQESKSRMIDLLRAELQDGDVLIQQEVAVEVLRLAGPQDLDAVASLLNLNSAVLFTSSVIERIAELAPQATAESYIGDDDRNLIEAGLRAHILQGFERISAEIVTPVLRNNDPQLRVLAVDLLADHLSISDLEGILADYVRADTYYYNVLTAIDRAIYGDDSYMPK